MTFLTPLLAGLVAAVAVPALVLLYFLKLRRREQEVSSTLLWKKAVQDLHANAPFQRLRRNILLILQLLALTGAFVALAQPRIRGQLLTGQRHVILIDRSASMSAADVPDGRGGVTTRLEDAKERALRLVDSMRAGGPLWGLASGPEEADEAMVIAFDAAAEVRQVFTSDQRALREAILAIEPTDAPTSLREAMTLARAQIPGTPAEDQETFARPPVSIHLFSDGRIPDASQAGPSPEDRFTFTRVGTPAAANAAIIGLRAERGFDDPRRLSVFVSLQNNEATPRDVDVELTVNGLVSAIRGATIPGATPDAGAASPDAPAGAAPPLRPGVTGVVFLMEREQGAVVSARLRAPGSSTELPADVLPADDQAWLVAPPARRLNVAVVTSGNLFLSAALEGLPLNRLVTLTPDQFESARQRDQVAGFDVVVLDGHLPAMPGREGDASGRGLPPGRWLVLGTLPVLPGVVDDGPGGAAQFLDWRREDPVLRHAALDSVTWASTRRIRVEPGSAAEAIASTETGAAVLRYTSAETTAVIVPNRIEESDWPFDVSFVVFMANAVGWLGDKAGSVGRVGGGGRMVQPGAVISDRLPTDASEIRLSTPAPRGEGRDRVDALTLAGDGRVVFGPLSRVGLYRLTWRGTTGPGDETGDGGRAERTFAANLFDPAESTIGSVDRVELATRVVEALPGTADQADRPLWTWFLLGALVLVLIEWWVYNRKVIV